VSTLLQFEELAFRAALEANPHDVNAALAFVDWLEQYGGMSSIGARREVVRIRREYAESAEMALAVSVLRDDPEFKKFAVTKCREKFSLFLRRAISIVVIAHRKPCYYSLQPMYARNRNDGRTCAIGSPEVDSDAWDVVPEERTAYVTASLVAGWHREYKAARQRA